MTDSKDRTSFMIPWWVYVAMNLVSVATCHRDRDY